MNVLVVAGGTGGHFYPGLSAAKELVTSGASVHFVVRSGDVVIPLVEKDGFSYSTILASGFERKLSFKNILSIAKLKIGFFQSLMIVLRYKPDVVLVMGGYLSIPPALAAKLVGIPIVMHEQNVTPGLANRVLARWARRVAVAFEPSTAHFHGKAFVSGNPVRPEFFSLPNRADAARRLGLNASKKTLLVFGGSLGARRLNDLVVESLGALSALASDWQVFHVTGPADQERIKNAYAALRFDHTVTGYCHDMAAAYAVADLVLCRAGASTVSELAVLKKPAVLVPYPFASENHQWANALVLKNVGAVEAYAERDLAGGKLTGVLENLLKNDAARRAMMESYGDVGRAHRTAAATIKDAVLALGRR